MHVFLLLFQVFLLSFQSFILSVAVADVLPWCCLVLLPCLVVVSFVLVLYLACILVLFLENGFGEGHITLTLTPNT